MKNKNEKIFVRVMKNGYIQQLGICGPIPNPIKVSRALAHSMVVGGVEVHEVNPITKATKKLTIHNIFSDDKPVATKATKPVEKTPISKTEKPVEPVTFAGVAAKTEEISEDDAEPVVVTTDEDAVSETEETVEEVKTEEKQPAQTSTKGKNKKRK